MINYSSNCLIVFLFTLLFQGCGENKQEKKYKNALMFYPQELISHFPEYNMKETVRYRFYSPYGTYANNWNGIHLVKRMTKESVAKIEQKVMKEAIAIKTFKDICNLIINFDPNESNISPYKMGLYRDTTKIDFPLPNFNYFYEMDFPSDFYDSAKMYVLETEPGEFLDPKYLTDQGVGLSKNWEHGYSKGVVISKPTNIVIYWLEVW